MQKACLKKYTFQNRLCGGRGKEMLSLQMKSGEYLTIGENIAVQVFQAGSSFRVSVQAPREIPILRGEVRERTAERPEGLLNKRPKSPADQKRDARKLAERRQRQQELRQDRVELMQQMDRLLDKMGGPEADQTQGKDLEGMRREVKALLARLERMERAPADSNE